MKAKTVVLAAISFFTWFITATIALAQEGHPMSGVWVGEWELNAEVRNRVVIVMEWTGTELIGTINPGPNAIPIKMATADPSDWSLHMEADNVDARGRSVTYIIDGTIDDLGTYNRTLAGTWNVDNQPGNFSITRQ